MDKIDNAIKEIAEGIGHYGNIPIERNKIRKHITWIGINGYTSSVGQWIREITKKIDEGIEPVKAYKWYTVINISPAQNMWYFGIRMEDDVTYICGGTTDFSGEGNFGRMIADRFITKFFSKDEIQIDTADALLSLIAEA